MKNDHFKDLIAELKGISLDKLLEHNILETAPNFKEDTQRGLCCPLCNSGNRDNHTGAGEFADNGFYCHACHNRDRDGHKLSPIDLFMIVRNVSDFKEAVKAMAAEFLGTDAVNYSRPNHSTNSKRKAVDEKTAKFDAEYLRLIAADVKKAQANIGNLPADARRGLSNETIEHFHFGYLSDWVNTRSRAEFNTGLYVNKKTGKTKHLPPPSRRIIIPTSDKHFNAVMLLADRTPDNKKYWKQHEGTIPLFNVVDLLTTAALIVVVEGELDVASIWQATGGVVAVIGDIGGNPNLVLNALKNHNITGKKFLILFDNDNGQNNAKALVDALITQGVPAVSKVFEDVMTDDEIKACADSSGKIDANQILHTKGNEFLSNVIKKLIDSAQIELATVAEKISVNDVDDNDKPVDDMEKYLDGLTEDLGNARRLEKYCGEHVKWSTDTERWLIWLPKGIWQRASDSNSVVSPYCSAFADQMKPFAEELQQVADTLKKKCSKTEADGHVTHVDEQATRRYEIAESKAAKAWKIARHFHKASKVNNAITLLKACSSILITSEDLDNHPNLLNCLNGVVDLEDGKLYQHDPTKFITQQVNADYRPDYRSTTVDEFLTAIQPDAPTRGALLRWLGYCLTGLTIEEKAFLFYGNGGNGKGTLTLLLMTLFNNYATSLPVTAVCESSRMSDAGAATTELNVLEKKRLAIVEELPQGRKLDTAKFKLLTGGDKIPIRRLYEEFTMIDPTHKIVISGNFRPELTDAHDDGLIRRINSVDFIQKFMGSKRNPHLKQKLLNPDALSGLLSLLVAEAIAWYKDGLIFSKAITESTDNYFAANDFLSEFVSEFCEYGSGKFVKLKKFVERLREEYPDETRLISDRHLKEMIKNLCDKQDGVEYQARHGKNRGAAIVGLTLIADDDWHGTPVDPADIPEIS